MSALPLTKASLVRYRNRPALIANLGEKLEIITEEGRTLKVRPKDVVLLHPGPQQSLAQLVPPKGEVEVAWELLAGTQTTLEELAELIFDEFTPASAWACWQLVAEGLYFHGEVDAIEVHSTDVVNQLQSAREHKEKEGLAWSSFMERVKQNKLLPEDDERMAPVKDLACGKGKNNKILKELGRQATCESAHALLLRLGLWDDTKNPYPHRFELPLHSADTPLDELDNRNRVDLTHLPAFAIDDEGNKDPDDAISLDGKRIWVHVADVAALIPPDSEADIEARGRAANSYLPESTTTMLTHAVTERLGLGLQEISPALSFGMMLSEEGEIKEEIEVVPSLVKVTRMTYVEAEACLHEHPFSAIAEITSRFNNRRRAAGAAMLELPEAKVKVTKDGTIKILPIQTLSSREMVTDAMLIAGEAAARFAIANQLPIPYATQDPPDNTQEPKDLAAMFAYRKQFKRSRMTVSVGQHSGLGLPIYTRATSPLRRYLDLVVHQQIRAHLRGEPLLSADQLLERVGAAEAVNGNLRSAERHSNKHWTLVYLKRRPDWCGKAILVDKRRGRGIVLIPELALDTQIHLEGDPPLNTELELSKPKVDLPNLAVSFKVSAWRQASVGS